MQALVDRFFTNDIFSASYQLRQHSLTQEEFILKYIHECMEDYTDAHLKAVDNEGNLLYSEDEFTQLTEHLLAP